MSRNVFKNKIECQVTSTFYSRMSPQFWLTQYYRKTNIFNNQYEILICKKKPKKTKKKLSIEPKDPSVSHVSPNVEDGSLILCINFKPTKRNPHKSIKGLQVQEIAQVAFDCILFGKSSHFLALFPISLAISHHRLNSRLKRKWQEHS